MRTVSIRSSLLRNFLALVLAVSITILAVLMFNARRAVHDLSEQLIERSSDRAEDAMTYFFGDVAAFLRLSHSWWDAGLLSYQGRDDIKKWNAVFMPLLEQDPQISSGMVVHDGGFEYLLFRDLRGGERYKWYNRIVWADRGPEVGFEARWTRDLKLDSEGRLPAEARNYDPRDRPFYTSTSLGKIHWTDPYYFFITKDAGMTASYKWRDPVSGQIRLVAFDLLLLDLSRFTAGLRPSRNGKVFVLHQDGSILGLPADPRWQTPDSIRQTLRHPGERGGENAQADRNAVLLTARELGLDAVGQAVEEWRRRNSPGISQFQYTSGGQSWWGGFRPFQLENQLLWIGVVVPETDFLAEAVRQRNQVIEVAGLALVVAVLMTGVLARRYSRPLEELARQSAKVRELRLTETETVRSSLREVAELASANAQMMTTLKSFSRYVPIDVVRRLLRRGDVARIGGRDAEITVLFTDIAGFTSLSENMVPQQLTDHMAEYFGAMLEELRSEHAVIDKFVGDAIMAFWGAPEPDGEQAERAVRAVLRCQKRLRGLNEEWARQGRPALPTRFGLNLGPALVGNVGSRDRLNYTVLGDTVNLASRVEAINKYYGTEALATEAVVREAGPSFAWRLIDRVAVKGKTAVVAIFEPLGEVQSVSSVTLERARAYEEALASYAEARFAEAAEQLEELLQAGSEPCAERLLALCRHYALNPQIRDWDGTTWYDAK